VLPSQAHARSHMPASASANGRGATRTVHFTRGDPGIETPVQDGRALAIGDEVAGPAVIDLPTTGIVVPPGATLTISDGGNFVLTFES